MRGLKKLMGLIGPMRPIGLMGLIGSIGLIGLIGLMGCSSDEESSSVRGDVTPISFSSRVADDVNDNESTTRAATPLKDETQTFYVWGFKNTAVTEDNSTVDYTDYQTVMSEFTVNWIENSARTTTSNTDGWEYVGQGSTPDDQTIKYWDWSAKAYRFFGVTGSKSTGWTYGSYEPNGANGDYGTYATLTLGVDASNPSSLDATTYYSKLWFSTGSLADYADKQFGQPVKLEFIKPYARVRFMFTFVEGLEFGRSALSGIHFGPTDNTKSIAIKGSVTIRYPLTGTKTRESWTSTPDYSTFLEDFTIDYYEADADYTPQNSSDPEEYDNSPQHWYAVLPIANQGTYTLQVIANGGEPKTAVVPAEYMTWAPGYEYTYRFKILESGGVVLDNIQVGINKWTSKGSAEHPLYNW